MSTKTAPKAAAAPKVEQPAAEAPAKAAKTKSITFLRSHPGYAYWPGDAAELDADKAAELIAGGFAQ